MKKNYIGCKVGQGDLTVMTLLTWCVALPTRCIYQVSNWYLKACWKKVQKTFRWLGALLTPPSECFCPPEGQKLPNHDEISSGQDTHYISVCTKSEASI